MAFMGRGDFPSMRGGELGTSKNNHHGYYRRPYFYRRFFYYIPLDNTYVIMQMIVTFIIFIIGGLTFISTYKSSVLDPIENTKSLFLNTHLIIIAIFLILSFIINYSSKNEYTLLKRLTVFLLISMLIMIIFLGIKLNLDLTYTRDFFEQFYTEQNIEDISSENDITKSKIDIGITGISMKTEKEYYVDECVKLYSIFKIKSYGTLLLHLLLNILVVVQISKISKIQSKKEQMNKNDAILFDEEQNVKF